jgi:hypothetical protein
MKKIQASKVKV